MLLCSSTHRALLAELAGVLPLLGLHALALAALARAVARAELVDVLAVGRDARLVGGAALARRVTCQGEQGGASRWGWVLLQGIPRQIQ